VLGAACGSFSSRESSRSACLRTSSGSSSWRQLLAQLVDLGLGRVLLASSSWIALSCWRST
jgi:hypothetical protein